MEDGRTEETIPKTKYIKTSLKGWEKEGLRR
jgi:hypothetical protein